jgi:Lipocalin-like domain
VTEIRRFVGAWELEEIEDFLDGNRGGAPAVGFERPVGLLIYVASGEMSVNFAGASRIPFLREFSPTPSELASAGVAYGGYAGRWEVDEARREVLHHVETAFVPNRVGRTIRRSYSFSEDLLLLRPIALAAGETAPDRVLRWRRRT